MAELSKEVANFCLNLRETTISDKNIGQWLPFPFFATQNNHSPQNIPFCQYFRPKRTPRTPVRKRESRFTGQKRHYISISRSDSLTQKHWTVVSFFPYIPSPTLFAWPKKKIERKVDIIAATLKEGKWERAFF